MSRDKTPGTLECSGFQAEMKERGPGDFTEVKVACGGVWPRSQLAVRTLGDRYLAPYPLRLSRTLAETLALP